MLVELENNLNIIYDDIKNKLLPENIKKDITILGVTGEYGGGDSEPITFELPEIEATYSDKIGSPDRTHETSTDMTVDGSNDWIYRSYLKYDIDKFIGKEVKIVEAKLTFYITDASWGDYASQSDAFVAAATSNWNEKTLTWNNQPAKPSYIDEQNTPSITNPQRNTWRTVDVTNIVKSWFEGLGNTGICLSARNEGQYRHQWTIANRRKTGYASKLTVTFQNKELMDTLDATATANDLLMGKTAYAVNKKITGTIPNNESKIYEPKEQEVLIADGYYKNSKISAIDITTLSTYQSCLAKSSLILGDVQPVSGYLIFYDKNLTDISGNNLSGRLVGSYIDTGDGINFTGGYGITGNVNKARGTWEIYCKINSNFNPINNSHWYNCSCVMGCELSDVQQDFAIILDSNGYVGIGYDRSSIRTGTNIKLNDGKYHHLILTTTDGSLTLYIDGKVSVSVAYSMSGSIPATYGIFWNNNSSTTAVQGEFKMFRYYTQVLTDIQIQQNYRSAIQNY